MQVERITAIDRLTSVAGGWNDLASGMPFRRYEWLATWWLHYGGEGPPAFGGPLEPRSGSGIRVPRRKGERELCILAVRDESGTLVGVAPWFLERTPRTGRVVRFLGGDDVCSDHLSLLTMPAHASAVASALADYLCGPAARTWDALVLEGVDASDTAVKSLAQELAAREAGIACCQAPSCWQLALPSSWDDYLRVLSKSHRGLMRRIAKRMLDSGRAQLRSVRDESELDRAWSIFVDLHQRRRRSLGQAGSFSSPAFAAFHGDVSRRLARAGSLHLDIVAIDGVPAAAEYGMVERGVVYVYQTGIAPEMLRHEPGRVAKIALVRSAIGEGIAAIDFLRGDEPYKRHFGARPSPCVELRVGAPHGRARWRHRAWVAGSALRRILGRGGLHAVGWPRG